MHIFHLLGKFHSVKKNWFSLRSPVTLSLKWASLVLFFLRRNTFIYADGELAPGETVSSHGSSHGSSSSVIVLVHREGLLCQDEGFKQRTERNRGST